MAEGEGRVNRQELFSRLRALVPLGRFTAEQVQAIDAIADDLGMARVGGGIGNADSTAKAIVLIKQFEGCRLDAYPDPGTGGDPWTIGWGATGPGIKKGVRWTQQQADERLASDVMRFADGVDAAVKNAQPYQRAALISFAYNVGIGAMKDSTLLRMHNVGDYVGAAAQFARWNKAGGKVLAGLTRRREAEAAMYRGEA